MSSEAGKIALFHHMTMEDPGWEMPVCSSPNLSVHDFGNPAAPHCQFISSLSCQESVHADGYGIPRTSMHGMHASSEATCAHDMMWKLEPLQVTIDGVRPGIEALEPSEQFEIQLLSASRMPLKVYSLLNAKAQVSACEKSDRESTRDSGFLSTRDTFQSFAHSASEIGGSELELASDDPDPEENLEACSVTACRPGSVGHPELCSRPCIYFAAGKCSNGNECQFCHEPHPHRVPHLDKRHRQMLKAMSFSTCLRLMSPIFKEKAASLDIPTALVEQLLDSLKSVSSEETKDEEVAVKAHMAYSFTHAFRIMSLRSMLSTLKRTAKSQNTIEVLESVLQAMIEWSSSQSANHHGTCDAQDSDMLAPGA
eukprot:gnl/TRDRNA2_/TRDRNA2_177241_c0_seq20.p1 gnl/TRDRNA2_/TRDRNA2_177241_c0~~gnl/TRDRNA2_/TRDRNA2_177241_c0_seq20.p1  ORF type:complete len:403 (+),score=52.90 gnl/TRDRNA2_/TRDRNA2_177241_c0_seq20:108-1211(+)